MTALTQRSCMLGPSINIRTEKHGEEDVPACDIPVGGIMLDIKELCALMNNPAAVALFLKIEGRNEPAIPQIQNIVLKGKRIGAKVTITVQTTGPDKVLALSDCKLKGLTLAPMSGGLTAMYLKIQTAGDHVPGVVGLLTAHLNGHIVVELGDSTLEEKSSKQSELPLNTFGDDEEAEAA